MSPPTAPRHHDPAVLKALVGDDPVALAETLQFFVTVGREWDAEIAAAAAAGDLRQLRELGHRMKSSARAIGATALGERCAAVEREAAAGSTTGALREAAHARAALAEVVAEIGPPAAIQPSSGSMPSGRE